MKKIISILLCLFLAAGALPVHAEDNTRLNIVATIFPEYDWVREILGDRLDNANLTLLLDNGVDLHSYQPTADDIIKIATCDLFIYVGGESDKWVEDALKEATNKDMVVINLLQVMGGAVKAEELIEGMQETEHDHDHDGDLTEEDIEDRSLSDFAGEWESLYPMLLDGKLDEYLAHKAEEDEDETATAETYREKYAASWASDVNQIAIDENKITFTYADASARSAEYTYAGHVLKTSDSGHASVRYQFETNDSNAPKYVQFNDHGHEPGKAEHFHIYFGDDGFDALLDAATNPYFVPAGLSNEDVLDGLMGHSHEHEEEADEHVWLSLKNAKVLCRAIADTLMQIDPDNAETYAANVAAYIEKLSALDAEYQAAIDGAAKKTVLFGDRFPFRYLVDDYGLDYYAAFVGCSAETEASFETIAFLAGKVDELNLSHVLTIEGANHKIAQTVAANTQSRDQQVVAMDSLQSTTLKDVQNGATYLSVMEKNLEVLKDALK